MYIYNVTHASVFGYRRTQARATGWGGSRSSVSASSLAHTPVCLLFNQPVVNRVAVDLNTHHSSLRHKHTRVHNTANRSTRRRYHWWHSLCCFYLPGRWWSSPRIFSSFHIWIRKSVHGQCAVANKFLAHPTLLAWLCNLGADGVMPGGDAATMPVCFWASMCACAREEQPI